MYYFSGIDRASFFEVLAREGAAGMVNASVATQPAMKASYRRYPELPLVLDSGAFQGVTNLAWYASVVHNIGADRFKWVANLDVIGDQGGSDENWLRLRDEMGVDALWIYQVEGGEGLWHLEQMMETAGPLVGIGGLVPVIKRNVREARHLIQSIGDVLQPWNRAHFFGVSAPRLLAEFGSEPWFASADSQAWLSGFKARELFTRDGRRVKASKLGLELSREECATQNVRQTHAWLSGEAIQFSLL